MASIINDEVLRDQLLGFDALLSDERLGTVAEVVASVEDTGQHLLRVTRSVDSAPLGSHADAHDADVWARLLSRGLQEQHLIPLVPAIIPRIDVHACTLWVDPPKGLLTLGRKHVLLAYLEIALQPFTGQPASASARMAGIRVMPTRKQLLDAGMRVGTSTTPDG